MLHPEINNMTEIEEGGHEVELYMDAAKLRLPGSKHDFDIVNVKIKIIQDILKTFSRTHGVAYPKEQKLINPCGKFEFDLASDEIKTTFSRDEEIRELHAWRSEFKHLRSHVREAMRANKKNDV